jgi:hypothetical protein
VGFAGIDLNYPRDKTKIEMHVKSILNTVFEILDESWYSQIFIEILDNWNISETKYTLIEKFFNGKRKNTRSDTAYSILDDSKDFDDFQKTVIRQWIDSKVHS